MARKTSKKKNKDAREDVGKNRKKVEKKTSISAHRSFRRSYREDYVRDMETPGIMTHFGMVFRMIFKNYKLFLPLMLIAAIVLISTIEALNETGIVFAVLVFLFLWLTTIFVVRRKMAGSDVGLREAIYNAMTPLASTLVVLLVAAIECIPIIIVIIAYSTAEETNFFAMPFYAFLFLVFAMLLILMSGYLLSSTLIALVAVSAPGIYPLAAFKAATRIMMGRKIKFVLRLIAVTLLFVAVWGVVIVPLVVLIKAPALVILICSEILACFGSVFLAIYLYMYYRWMLDYDTKEVK